MAGYLVDPDVYVDPTTGEALPKYVLVAGASPTLPNYPKTPDGKSLDPRTYVDMATGQPLPTYVLLANGSGTGGGGGTGTGADIAADSLVFYDPETRQMMRYPGDAPNQVFASTYQVFSIDGTDLKPSAFYYTPSLTAGGFIHKERLLEIVAEAMAVPDAHRIVVQFQGVALQWFRMPDGLWSIAPSAFAEPAGVTHGYAFIENDPVNPLFVKIVAGAVVPDNDATELPATYLTRTARYIRLNPGAKATLRFTIPVRLRSVDIPIVNAASGYMFPPLAAQVYYADGSNELAVFDRHTSGVYLSSRLDQTATVESIDIIVDPSLFVGTPSILKLKADGTTLPITHAGFAASTDPHVVRYNYVYAYNHHFLEKFYPPVDELTDITADYTLTASSPAAPSVGALTFAVANMTDSSPVTYYKPNTYMAGLSLTLTRTNGLSARYPMVCRITLALDTTFGSSTLQSVVSGTANIYAAGNITSNTQQFRGIVAANGTTATIEILVGQHNTMKEASDRITITLTKLSSTSPYAITKVQLLGA